MSTTRGIALDNATVVEHAVIGTNYRAVDPLPCLVFRHGTQVDVAVLQFRDEGVGIAQRGAAPGQQLDDVERRRLPHVADVSLVRDTEEMDPGTVHGFLRGVEGLTDALDDVRRH